MKKCIRESSPEEKKLTLAYLSLTKVRLSPTPGNICCLGRYKGVILLLGTSPLWSHFIFLFSLHRSLYLISYSRVWLPQTSWTPFIFIWKTHLVLKGCQRVLSEERGVQVWNRPRQVSLHANVLLQGLFGAKLAILFSHIFTRSLFNIIKKNYSNITTVSLFILTNTNLTSWKCKMNLFYTTLHHTTMLKVN